MKKIITLFIAVALTMVIGKNAMAQNVAINASGTAANTSAGLDVDFTNKGFLLPRVTAAQRAAIASPATGLIVYQTDAGTLGSGFYFYNGSAWTPWGTNNGGWGLVGNTGTVATTNYLGTTDAVDLVFKTGGTEAMRVTSGQRLGIGTTTPGYRLEVASGAADAVYGHSTNVGGILGYETNFTVGSAGTLQGAGVYAANPTAGYTSTFAQSTGAATVAANINYSSVWIASYSLAENTSNTNNPPSVYAQLGNTGTTLGGVQAAVRGYSTRGTTAGNPGYTSGGQFTGDAQNQDAISIFATAYSNSGTGATYDFGGYFEAYNYAGTTQRGYAFVGGRTGGANVKIIGTGSVSEIIPTPTHGRIKLTCPESPEYWYQDYGTVTLTNGKAHVDLDPILADIIVVNAENPLRIFCTPVDMLDYNGVAIVNKTASGFDIVEVNGGTHSGTIDYQIIAKPKTNYGEGRFTQAPGPAWLKPENEPAAAKAANQNSGKQIFNWPSDPEVYNYQDLAKKHKEEATHLNLEKK